MGPRCLEELRDELTVSTETFSNARCIVWYNKLPVGLSLECIKGAVEVFIEGPVELYDSVVVDRSVVCRVCWLVVERSLFLQSGQVLVQRLGSTVLSLTEM